jgi:hypothetical protein
MAVLLAAKVSPHTVNNLSAYRSLYNDAVSLGPHDFTTAVRLIAGFAALILFFVLLAVAFKQFPRPYLARGTLALGEPERGTTTVAPRAVERVAESAAQLSRDVTSAAGRLGDGELSVSISVRTASGAATALREARDRVHEALERHELPDLPVNVTLTGYDRRNRRELS